ncbi:MAG: hypothetical protein QXS76_04445, partial [Candidatus Bathyarchaeia archaeon]
SVAEFVQMFLPPVVLVAIMSGLVAGKIAEGTISAGFKHAIIMSVITLIAVWISGTMSVQFISMPSQYG